ARRLDRSPPRSRLERSTQGEKGEHAPRVRPAHDSKGAGPGEADAHEIGRTRLRKRQAGSIGACEDRARSARTSAAEGVTRIRGVCAPGADGRRDHAEMRVARASAEPGELAWAEAPAVEDDRVDPRSAEALERLDGE